VIPSRWPRKPPSTARCDAHVGASYDFTGAPVVHGCQNPAVETVLCGLGEMWLCQPCADSMVARGVVRRNPKRKVPVTSPPNEKGADPP
jgi:hypothetical protein